MMVAVVVALPIALGALLGFALRRFHGRRFTGFGTAVVFFALPPLIAMRILLQFPILGFWDALLEGVLVGVGVVSTAHRAFASRRNLFLAVSSLLVSLVVLEFASRLFLPPPPDFPRAEGAHFLLADAMRAGTQSHSWDLRSKEIVCSVVYGDQYPGILDISGDHDIVVPRTFIARADMARKVLHIGDSMTFGFGVPRDKTFPATLERLDPSTQHINAGIPGTAPDAYLLVLRQWIARHNVDLVVLYLFEGNDLIALDDLYPCCRWQSLLAYSGEAIGMRCPTAASIDFGEAGATWLRYNSPPPYLVRVLIGYSSAAAHLGAAIVRSMSVQPLLAPASREDQILHLQAILQAAHNEVRARNIPLVVVVLPESAWVERRTEEKQLAPAIANVARRDDIKVLDASEMLRAAADAGEKIYLDHDPHFSVRGNELVANWLHRQWTQAADDGKPQ